MSSDRATGKLNQYDSVVIFSTADWDNPFWTNKQHMACQLADKGFRVLYVESLGLRKVVVGKSDILRILRRLGRFFYGARMVRENIWVYSPLVLPFHHLKWARRLNSRFLIGVIRYLIRRLGFKKSIAWVYNPMVVDLLKSLHFKKVVYHSVDDLSAAPRLPGKEIEKYEKQLLDLAEVTFVTSPTLQVKYRSWSDKNILYFPNVADYNFFSQARAESTSIPQDISHFQGPKIGFVGAISSYKVDFEMLAKAAKLTPSWNWILIGKVGEGEPETNPTTLNQPNIYILGPRPYQELPSYLKAFDVVMIPSPLNDYTRSMFPMKFFEYLAGGKVIVSSRLPSLEEFLSAYLPADNAEQMIAQIERVLSGEVTFSPLMDRIAKENTWEQRLEYMLEAIGACS